MTCTRCTREIDVDSAFCRFCGAPTRESSSSRRLTRLPATGQLGGVCAGMAAYLNTDVTIVRLAWVILSVVPGAIIGGLLAYAAAWLILPTSAADAPQTYAGKRLRRSATDRKIGGVCGGFAEYLRSRLHTRQARRGDPGHLSRRGHLRRNRLHHRVGRDSLGAGGDIRAVAVHALTLEPHKCSREIDVHVVNRGGPQTIGRTLEALQRRTTAR